ncbi:hypothetical protein [Clostridium tertium]|uniref:hypothetical protein n=1 Tax=Clostridium tertium TaxID=1559 RepID=UPI0035675613
MEKIKEKDILNFNEQCSELRLIGHINGEEVEFELDKIARIMIIGYLSKKGLLHI